MDSSLDISYLTFYEPLYQGVSYAPSMSYPPGNHCNDRQVPVYGICEDCPSYSRAQYDSYNDESSCAADTCQGSDVTQPDGTCQPAYNTYNYNTYDINTYD